MHNDTDDLLRQILAELQGQNGLLRTIAAEQIAAKQTLKNILQVDESIDGYVSELVFLEHQSLVQQIAQTQLLQTIVNNPNPKLVNIIGGVLRQII